MQYISTQYEVFVFLVGAGLALLVPIAAFIQHTRTKRPVAVVSHTL